MAANHNLVRVLSENGGAAVLCIDSTDICREAQRVHGTSATMSAALGRLLTGAALMGSMLKSDEESVTLRVNGGGAAGTVLAISDDHGNVRGSCGDPRADLPLNAANGKLNVGGVVGKEGLLTVIRDTGLKGAYTGSVPLVSGEIAEDLTSYFAVSEQIPTVCALGVLVNPDLTVRAAGGYILQLLPGASEDEIALIEKNVASMDAISSLIEAGNTPMEIAFRVLSGFAPQVLDETHCAYRCNCSREKMTGALMSIGKEELRRLCEEQRETEIVCGYCNKKYLFSEAEMLALVQRAQEKKVGKSAETAENRRAPC
ncbi:MAG: Hsp33 family molecular chaperone HslO [Oscillospiraceae bacterium]|nr:Hsp33 family molecular chaperone HslO [Oscillospiraceae bacterium]